MKKAVLYPFLFAIYPVLLLYSNNIDRAPFSKALRIFLVLLLAAVLLVIIFRLLTRSWYRAGLISSLFLLLFTSYGHVYTVFNTIEFMDLQVGRADYLAALYAALLIFFSWFFWRKLRNPVPLGSILNITSIALVCFPLVNAWSISQRLIDSSPSLNGCAPEPRQPQPSLPKPDIYYIILDEYGRSDMLDKVLEYDNSAFIGELKRRGFYIADQSYSNYAISLMSIASSLNYCYINDWVVHDQSFAPQNTRLLTNAIRDSNARAFLEKAGYRFITLATSYAPSEIEDSDLFLKPAGYLNPLEIEFVKGSMLAIFGDAIEGAQSRMVIHAAFENLSALPENEPGTPKFVFAHIQSNHTPYVFGPDGEVVRPWGFSPAQVSDGINANADSRTYASAYRDQAKYANKLILATIDEILRNSTPKPVIILQGDHGTQQLLNWLSVEETCVKERHAILNAYYFPDGDYANLYPGVTPVNSFRLLFNKYFGAGLPLQPDRVYFSEWFQSYEYLDVTEKMQDCEYDVRSD